MQVPSGKEMEDFEKSLVPYLGDREAYVLYLNRCPNSYRTAWTTIAVDSFLALTALHLPVREGNDFRKQTTYDVHAILAQVAEEVGDGEAYEADMAYDVLLTRATASEETYIEMISGLAGQPFELLDKMAWLLHRTGYGVIFHEYSINHTRYMFSRAALLRAQLVKIRSIVQDYDWPPETADVVLEIMTALDDTSASYRSIPGDEAINSEEGDGSDNKIKDVVDWETWFKL